MEVIGIICEYSPFHNGHLYHINKIKESYPDSLLVLCLNGYFLERGQISLLSKESKTRIALFYGVDIVVELPTLYGTQSADTFAEKSITLLHTLGVQKIIFGSETEDRNHLRELASLQLENSFKLENVYNISGINAMVTNYTGMPLTQTVTSMEEADMKAESFVTALNNNKENYSSWKQDTSTTNKGYPIFE